MSSSNTETRILQMQLENKDFEDGVRQTIKSLENLEEKLNLKNAGDGFEKVSAAANSVQMSHLESGLETVTSKFTLMGQIGLQVLERISSKVVDVGERILRSATIQPMIDGWGEFEMKTNSVQTILGGIRNRFDDQPSAINAISDALNDLNTYADKTIYNFAQMTENVGKFTNQGLGLEESTNAIKGIANWAAAVGADPAQMSRAMYNISQSLGAGSMQLIDWRSIRFANMATPEVKKLFAEVAKKQGLVSEDGKIQIGKQIFDVMEDFEGSLKGGWLTNEVMAEAFGIYAKAFSEEELIAEYGEELGKQFYEMGVYAEEAATKVRTFSQLIGVLKESLGSGWANTFDILFGGFEQQTAFLTSIKERIEEIINFQTDDRNTWLQNFSDVGGIVSFQDSILRAIDILSDFYWVFNDVIALVLNPFGDSVFNMSDGIFGPRMAGYTDMQTTWEGVKGIFDDINNTMDKFRQWMYTPNEKSGRSPIHNLASALSGVAGAAGIAFQVLTGFGKFVFRIFKRFEPVVSSVLDLLGQIGGAIYNVFFNLTGQQTVEKFFEKLESWVGPAVDLVANLASAVIDLIHSLLGIDSAADDWTVLGERMEAFWDIFTYDENLTFAENLKNSLKKALVSVFGQDTADSLIKSWDENVAPVLEKISGFFTQAFDDLNRVIEGLKKSAEADYSQEDSLTGKAGLFLNSFLSGFYGEDQESAKAAYEDVLGIYQEIRTYYDENIAPHVAALTDIFTVKLPQLNAQIFDFIFGHEITGKRGNTWREGGLLQTIEEFFKSEDMQSTIDTITSFFGEIGDKLTEAWDKFYAFLFGKDVEVLDRGRWRQGHQDGLFEIIEDYFTSETWQENWELIKKAFENISGWITSTGQSAWNTIMNFLFGEETTDKQGKKSRNGGAYEAALSFLTPVWDWIQSTGQYLYDYITKHNFEEMWQGLNSLLFGYNATVFDKNGNNIATEHKDGVLSPIIDLLKPISDAFSNAKTWVLEKMAGIDWGSIWDSIGKFFNGYDTTVFDKNGNNIATEHHKGMFEKIMDFFNMIIDYFQSPEFQSFLGTIKTFYHNYIEPVLTWLGGLGTELGGAFSGLLSGQGFSAFESVGTYLKGGLDTLIGSIFPEGFDLQNILGGLFGGDGKEASDGKSSKPWSILDLFMGSAEAGAAGAEDLMNASGIILAAMDNAEGTVKEVSDQGVKTSGSILDAITPLLPYLGGAAAMGLVGKVSDLVTGITGNRKPTIIEQIGSLLSSFGGIFQGLGILVGAAGIAEKISPGTIDKVFGHITGILNTVFGWILGITGGGMLISGATSFLGNWGLNALTGSSKQFSFDSMTNILSGIGEGISGLFGGLQSLFNLTWEVMGADILMGAENFDKRIDRVLGFVGKVISAVLTNSGWLELAAVINSLAEAGFSKLFSKDAQIESLTQMMSGLGHLVSGVGDGIAAMMTASIVPGVMNVDTSKLVDLVNAVFSGLNGLLMWKDVSSAINTVEALTKSTLVSKIGELADAGIIVGLFTALGKIAGDLVKGYLKIAEERMVTMGPTVYTFVSNIAGSLEALASIGSVELSSAEGLFKEDLPKLLDAITSDDLRFNKEALDERGKTIRDFGNRIYNGINTLSKAKDVFDKYNTGGQFPLDFFKEMTEALQYLKGDDISELYDSVFGQNGFFVGDTGEKADVDGLNSFFKTIGDLGWVITKSEEWNANAGIQTTAEKLESTKDGLDAFQDAFSGIQVTFSSLVDDITREGFDIEKLNAVGDLLTKITESAGAFVNTFESQNSDDKWALFSMINKASPISQFSGWIQGIGTALHDMAGSIKPEDEAGLNLASGTLGSLYTTLQTMTAEQVSAYASAFEGIKKSLILSESEESTLATLIESTVNAAAGKEVNLTITPIVDDSNLSSQLPNGMQMENTYSRMITMQMNMNDVYKVSIDATQISQLVTANNRTRDKIDSLATSLRGLKVQINLPGSSAAGPVQRKIETYPLVANYILP